MTPILTNNLPDTDIDDGDEDAASTPASSAIELKLTPEFCGVRLDKALSQLLTEYSRSRIQQWIDAGHVLVDGQAARGKTPMLGDETIVIEPQEAPEEQPYQPEPLPLAIVHEDKAILVIDKPAGLVVHPAAGNWSGTLLNGLLHHQPALAGVPRAGIVHRLDKDTSGLMVVAKSLQAQTDLVRQLQARSVKREYLALVWGQPQLTGRVDAAIGRHPRDRIKMAVSQHESAKPAVTHYQRIATGAIDGRPVSLMRCQLETGRTHQIRVHLQSIGFGLVGDPLYGKPHLASVFPRQALHAFRLGLVHPVSGKDLEWNAPLPADFSGLLAQAGMSGVTID
ncbi:MAG TPA: RluA family pseudouridine synthase [Noviherbaspirillum sp.]|uniref:RluA family pseudouridine synthase n=1 Tax=Noviherbaspirillum sp. TaxID=1926288 RepID=UPI002D506971|nr:RluA family pseudouridine synthase [Noviherbaspirillum sp.]HYD95508.1 RluA family pseudouridine synthase [Noviherbaspirillum sp.]